MANKKSYYERANLLKRMHRRQGVVVEMPDVEFFKEIPRADELKAALSEAKKSTSGILRLAALMDNLSVMRSPRYVYEDQPYRARTPGIRRFLEGDPELKAKYKTLMRYKSLARRIREVLDLWYDHFDTRQPMYNLLWGLEENCPEDAEFNEDVYERIRALYSSFEGMNFTEIMRMLEA